MTPEDGISLYFARASRAFSPLWLLEELGVPYRLKRMNLARGDQKRPAFLRLNPMGKVPVLTDGAAVVSESPAICLYLADRYDYGGLAPAITDPRRGDYLRWMVFATAVFEPAVHLEAARDDAEASGVGWGHRRDALAAMDQALSRGPWLLGARFSAADVMLGSLLSIALFNKRIADPPASFAAYDARLSARSAYRNAAEITWGAPAVG